MITIIKVNEVFLKISAEKYILQELSNYFTFDVDGARFSPAFKQKLWNGKKHLFNLQTRMIYAGLYKHILVFAEKSGYTINENSYKPEKDNYSIETVKKFVKEIVKPASQGIPLETRDYQIAGIHHCVSNKRATILSPTSCHKKGDKVLMSNGKFKNIEDIKVGDYVIGNDGKHKRVLRVFKGENVELYDIIPKNSKNKKITVTSEHILPLKFSDYKEKFGYGKGDKNYIEYITVSDYLKKPKYYKHCANMFYNDTILHFDNEKDPDINLSPYFIGCYIGDGSSYGCAITSKDKEIIQEIYAQANKLSCIVKRTTSNQYGYKIVGSANKENLVFREFNKFGLYFSGKNRIKCEERFIPFEFINSSEAFRLELLAGLIDTDGYYSNAVNYEYSSKSIKLCEDVQLLAMSLGFKTTVSSKLNKIHNRLYYTTRISGDISKIPVRIPRKKYVHWDRKVQRSTHRKKFDIEFHGIDDFYGIEVEDHLYITNDGLITHNSGKSLIIYSIVRFLLSSKKIKRALFIFPGTSLVEQMYKDFIDYSSINEWDVVNRSHAIFSGQEKQTDKTLTFATYQSLAKMPISFFKQFDCVVVDECQTAKSKSIVDIMERCHNIEYRFGFSGTIPDGKSGKAHRLVIEGLFDKVFETISTDELIKRGQVTNLKIKAVLLKYPDEVRKLFPKVKYPDEIKYLIDNKQRNKFIVNLANNLTGNTLILFNFIEHGKLLLELLKDRSNVHFITGDNSVEERENVRQIAESTNDCVIVATYGVFSTGINIRNLHNCVIASPTKSKIRLFQSLGRILRLSNGKTVCTLYDIGDDLSWKSNKNHTLNHFMERIKYYAEAKLKYKIIEHQLIKQPTL